MIKTKQIQNRLVKYSIFVLVITAVLSAVLFFLIDFIDEQEKEFKNLERQTVTNNSEYKRLDERFKSSEESFQFYKQYVEKKVSGRDFNRETLRDVLVELKQKHKLTDLRYSMDPFSEEGGQLRKENAVAISSQVKIQFAALSDLSAYRMLEDIMVEFPGKIIVEKLMIQKEGDIDDDMFLRVSRREVPRVVSGELDFRWYGMKQLEVKEEKPQQNRRNNEGSPPQ